MSENWTKRAVILEVNESTVMAIVGEEIELTKFAILEFPKKLQYSIKPGFSFDWTCCEGIFSITLPGNNPVG